MTDNHLEHILNSSKKNHIEHGTPHIEQKRCFQNLAQSCIYIYICKYRYNIQFSIYINVFAPKSCMLHSCFLAWERVSNMLLSKKNNRIEKFTLISIILGKGRHKDKFGQAELRPCS